MNRQMACLLSLVAASTACSSEDSKDESSVEGATALPDDDGDGVPAGRDCNDTDPTISPDAVEVCDGIDNDCDGLTDSDDPDVDLSGTPAYYPDADGDGYGDALASGVQSCAPPVEDGVPMVTDHSDCNDGDAAISPVAVEVCDEANVDEDCNGVADDDDPGVDTSTGATFYPDQDADGHGDEAAAGMMARPRP